MDITFMDWVNLIIQIVAGAIGGAFSPRAVDRAARPDQETRLKENPPRESPRQVSRRTWFVA